MPGAIEFLVCTLLVTGRRQSAAAVWHRRPDANLLTAGMRRDDNRIIALGLSEVARSARHPTSRLASPPARGGTLLVKTSKASLTECSTPGGAGPTSSTRTSRFQTHEPGRAAVVDPFNK